MNYKRFGEFGAWLITDKGRSFCMGLATTIGIGFYALKTFPNTFLLDQYKEVVHLYKDGMMVKLSDSLKQRFEKAVDLVNIKQEDRKLFKPFPVFGFDTFFAGSTYSKYGVIVGVPVNFTYEDVDDIDKGSIKVNHESVIWDLPEGQQLLDSYVLSENAQLYAMAREIKMGDSSKFLLDTANVLMGTSIWYGITTKLNKRLNLYAKPRQVRMVMYTLAIAFSLGLYLFVKDFTQVAFEQKVDKFLKEKHPIFAEGGKEYYEKMLQRNRAVRKFLGKEGENLFSVLGNENFFLRQKHVPLVHRKAFFESKEELM